MPNRYCLQYFLPINHLMNYSEIFVLLCLWHWLFGVREIDKHHLNVFSLNRDLLGLGDREGVVSYIFLGKYLEVKKKENIDKRKILRLDAYDSSYSVTSFFPLPFREGRCYSSVMNLLYTESRVNLQERETMNRSVGRIEH